MKKISSKFKSKPSYDLYIQLWYTLDFYLMTRIDEYIYLKYYNWNIPNMHLVKQLSIKELNILKAIYEYDYEVFKTLLFLYWDLECYLENKDYVKNTLIVDTDKFNFLKIKFSNKDLINIEFWNKIKIKKPINLWTNIEIKGMIEDIFKYDIYSKLRTLDTRHKDESYISIYRLYRKHNDTIWSFGEMYQLREASIKNQEILSLYYRSYIEDWYKEWNSELSVELTKKYKVKIQNLDVELNKLIESIVKNNK